jgi:TatD DNase family protein
VHPHDAKDVDDTVLKEIEEMSFHPKVVAIGEIGLDFHYNFSPKEKQREVFRTFLQMAKQRALPIVVHNRESDDAMMEIIESEMSDGLRGQFHCFGGSASMAQCLLELGFHISFTGNITFKNVKLDDVVKSVPLEKLLLETDAPYMTPVPHRGKRNEPARVVLVAEKIAEIKGVSVEEVGRVTSENCRRLFGVGRS